MFDYGRAFFFARHSQTNRLFIEVDSRIKLSGGEAEEYWLLAPHPREQTFKDDGCIYSAVLDAEQGASEVIFMIDQLRNRAIVCRRYDVPGQPAHFRREVGPSPYTGSLHNPPVEVQGTELRSVADLSNAIDAGRRIVATVEYSLHGRDVVIEFPVRVLNLNPEPSDEGKQWQVASPMVPVFIESEDPNERVRPGYVAFGRMGENVVVSMVYLVDVAYPRPSQDFSATLNQTATARLFAIDRHQVEQPAGDPRPTVFIAMWA